MSADATSVAAVTDLIWEPVELDESNFVDDVAIEQMGTKEKYWVHIPDDDREWLVKLPQIDTRDGTVAGEDWAEWTVQHLAAVLGLPAAIVRPATFQGRCASVSRNMLADESERLIHGNELLSATFPDYDQSLPGENPGYTPEAVRTALESVGPPLEAPALADFTAYDVWAGYLLMDAWVAGQDRHHENWGLIQRGAAGRYLAPSFDHGNALGFQERDERRSRMLDDEAQFLRWINRGSSRYFAGKPTLVDLALGARHLAAPEAAAYWIARLEEAGDDPARSILAVIPEERMSEVTRMFVVRLLAANRRRLLDGYASTRA